MPFDFDAVFAADPPARKGNAVVRELNRLTVFEDAGHEIGRRIGLLCASFSSEAGKNIVDLVCGDNPAEVLRAVVGHDAHNARVVLRQAVPDWKQRPGEHVNGVLLILRRFFNFFVPSGGPLALF